MPKPFSFGCKPTELPTHRFPDPDKFPEQFKALVALVGGKLQTASNYEYYRKRIICDKHFTNSDKNRHNWLNKLAVPSLNLNELLVTPISQIMLNEEACASNVDQVSAPSVIQAGAPTPDTDELVTASRNHVKINKKAYNSIIDQASTSSGLPATVPIPKRASDINIGSMYEIATIRCRTISRCCCCNSCSCNHGTQLHRTEEN